MVVLPAERTGDGIVANGYRLLGIISGHLNVTVTSRCKRGDREPKHANHSSNNCSGRNASLPHPHPLLPQLEAPPRSSLRPRLDRILPYRVGQVSHAGKQLPKGKRALARQRSHAFGERFIIGYYQIISLSPEPRVSYYWYHFVDPRAHYYDKRYGSNFGVRTAPAPHVMRRARPPRSRFITHTTLIYLYRSMGSVAYSYSSYSSGQSLGLRRTRPCWLNWEAWSRLARMLLSKTSTQPMAW